MVQLEEALITQSERSKFTASVDMKRWLGASGLVEGSAKGSSKEKMSQSGRGGETLSNDK